MTTERMVHLALSQKAAAIMREVIESAVLEYDGDDEDIDDILEAIRADLKEQIEAKPKKPKKKGAKK